MSTQNNACYIQLITSAGTTYNIELDKDIPISLNYAASDIRDVGKKNSNYSKQIPIPNTPGNNIALGQLWDINSTNYGFDINIKNSCIVFSDDEIVLRGYMQLTGVKKTSKSNSQGEQLMYYQSVVYDETASFINQLGDSYLENLDLSRYNHTITPAGILQASAHTYSSGYTYPLLYKSGETAYYTQDFKPCIFSRSYTDQLIAQAGYTYSSTFLTGTTYSNLVVPPNHYPSVTGNTALGHSFLADAVFLPIGFGPTGTTALGNYITFMYDNASINPLGQYNTTTGELTHSFTGFDTIDAGLSFQLDFFCNQDMYLFGAGYDRAVGVSSETGDASLYYTANAYIGDINGDYEVYNLVDHQLINYKHRTAQTPITAFYKFAAGYDSAYSSDLSLNSNNNKYSGITLSKFFEQGDVSKVYIEIILQFEPGAQFYDGITSISNMVNHQNILFKVFQGSNADPAYNHFSNVGPENQLIDNSPIYINDWIPRKVKQRDFFSSTCQLFNLYVEQDPANSNNLFIETRDIYYSAGTALDWSDKLAIDKEIEVKYLTELQGSKSINFTWTEDSADELLNLYKAENNLVYGELTVDFAGNAFISGQKIIKPIFTMTPTYTGPVFSNPVPFVLGENPTMSSLRVLYKTGPISGYSYNFRIWDGASMSDYFHDKYYTALEYDHPVRPTVNLNWTNNQDVYYDDLAYLPLNDLYNVYYYNTVRAISNSKMLIGWFHLTPKDIATLRMNARIWLNHTNCWFIINKIQDFNPMQRGLTKVELLRYDG